MEIRGMFDCIGKQVREGDIVEFLDWCYASRQDRKEARTEWKPLYGIVKWNTEYFTYEPLIFSTEDFNGNCFANVCQYEPPKYDYPATYFKVIGNIDENPEVLKMFEMTQEVTRS